MRFLNLSYSGSDCRYVDVLLMMTLVFVMITIDYKSMYTIGRNLSADGGFHFC